MQLDWRPFARDATFYAAAVHPYPSMPPYLHVSLSHCVSMLVATSYFSQPEDTVPQITMHTGPQVTMLLCIVADGQITAIESGALPLPS